MRRTLTCICVVGLLVLSTCAWASANGPLIVKATSGGKTATWAYNWLPGVNSFSLGGPVQLRAADNSDLGTLNNLNCSMDGDPFLTLNFAVQAVGDTTFTFDTGEVAVPVVNPALGFATAAATLTADANGAAFTGNFAGGKAYEATFNGGTVFADLDSSFTSPPNTSMTEAERMPLTDFAAIGVPVTSMRAQWNFNLSAGDGASGTSRYDIESPIPDASTLALALAGAPVLAGFAIRRRRQA